MMSWVDQQEVGKGVVVGAGAVVADAPAGAAASGVRWLSVDPKDDPNCPRRAPKSTSATTDRPRTSRQRLRRGCDPSMSCASILRVELGF